MIHEELLKHSEIDLDIISEDELKNAQIYKICTN